MTIPDETTASGRDRAERRTVSPPDEVRAVTRLMFDRLFPVVLVVGVPTLAVAVWRTLQFGWRPIIGVYVLILAILVTVLGLHRRLPLAIVSFVFCAVGVADAVLTLFSYGFASAALLLLCLATISAGVFFGLRGGLIAYGISLSLLAAIAGLICTGVASLSFDAAAYMTAPSAWGAQIIHFALLTLLGVVMINAIQTRLIASFTAVQARKTELMAANQVLQAEVATRIKVERDLNRSEAQYRMLAAHMYDIMFQQDLELNLIYVSPSVEKMFGYTVDEAMRIKMPEFLTPDSLERMGTVYAMYMQQAIKGEVDVPLQEFEYIRKDGTTFWGEMAVKFLRDDQGNPTGSLGVLRDVTDRHRAQAEKETLEEQLRQSEKMEVLGQLAGGIAHDFNNQLAGIMGYAELLKSGKMGDAFVEQASEMIGQCARRAGELTGKLLAFARKGSYKAVPVDMHEIIREVSSILERSIDKSVSIAMALKATRAVVIGDPSQLQNAFLNLALNARDAMPMGGQIRFTSALADRDRAERAGAGGSVVSEQYIELQVRDTGIGMDEQTLRRIFEPFYTTKEQGQGTGMGLAAVHGTAVAHNGAVTVGSEPGVGTTFSVFLPLSPEAISTAQTLSSSPPGGGGRILLIEDETAVRRVVHMHLTSLGYEVETAPDGAQGIALFNRRGGAFDLVLLDLILPRLDGSSVFTSLRALSPNLKVLLLSGHSGNIAVTELMHRGALDLIRKPFTLSHLSTAVAKALSDQTSQTS